MKPLDIIASSPNAASITKYDLTYIERRIVHERFNETSKSGMNLENSRVYEAGRTSVEIAKFLLDQFEISSMEFSLGTEKNVAEAWIHLSSIRLRDTMLSVVQVNPILYIKYEGEEIAGTMLGSYMLNLYYADNEEGITWSYQLDPSGIISYDMTFPPPSIFVHQIVREVFNHCNPWNTNMI